MTEINNDAFNQIQDVDEVDIYSDSFNKQGAKFLKNPKMMRNLERTMDIMKITGIEDYEGDDGTIYKRYTVDVFDIETGEIKKGRKYYASSNMLDIEGNDMGEINIGDKIEAQSLFSNIYFGKRLGEDTIGSKRGELRRQKRAKIGRHKTVLDSLTQEF